MSALTSCALTPAADSEYKEGLLAFTRHDYQAAELHLNKSIELCNEQDGQDHRTLLADTLLSLARVESEQGKYASAERTLKRVIETLTTLHGAESHEVAAALLQLSVCHHLQAEYEEGLPVCRRALAIEEKLKPGDDLLMAATLNNLAETYLKLEDDQQPEKLFERALSLYRAHRQEDRAKAGIVDTLNNVALFYRRQNRLQDARQIGQQALAETAVASTVALQGRASSLNTMAAVERADFNVEQAAKDYQLAIALLEKSGPAGNDQLCQITDNYADMLLDMKDYDHAERLYKKSIQAGVRAHGRMHPAVAERMNDLADLYRWQDRFDEAQPLLEQVLAVDRVAFEMDSPITFDSINNLSAVYVAQKKYRQAQAVYADWMPTLVAILGPDHPHVADALDNWALVAERSNNLKMASDLKSKARKIRRQAEQPVAQSAPRL